MGPALTRQRLGQRDAVSLFARFLTEGAEITLTHVALLDTRCSYIYSGKGKFAHTVVWALREATFRFSFQAELWPSRCVQAMLMSADRHLAARSGEHLIEAVVVPEDRCCLA